MADIPNTSPPLNLRRTDTQEASQPTALNWDRLKKQKPGGVQEELVTTEGFLPQVEGLGVDAGAVRKQPVEHGGLPSDVERRHHETSTGEPRLVADAVGGGRLRDRREDKVQKWLEDTFSQLYMDVLQIHAGGGFIQIYQLCCKWQNYANKAEPGKSVFLNPVFLNPVVESDPTSPWQRSND